MSVNKIWGTNINSIFTFIHSCPNATIIFDTVVGFCVVQSFTPSYIKDAQQLTVISLNNRGE
jgi:hypothetical protein